MITPNQVKVIDVILNHPHLEIMSYNLPHNRVFCVEAIDHELRVSEFVMLLILCIYFLSCAWPRRPISICAVLFIFLLS